MKSNEKNSTENVEKGVNPVVEESGKMKLKKSSEKKPKERYPILADIASMCNSIPGHSNAFASDVRTSKSTIVKLKNGIDAPVSQYLSVLKLLAVQFNIAINELALVKIIKLVVYKNHDLLITTRSPEERAAKKEPKDWEVLVEWKR